MDKKIKYLMMFAAIAALATGLTACSSEDDLASDEQQRGVVKTEFTISFPQTTTGITRLGSDIVQVAAENNQTKFRGIKGIKLYPFNLTTSGVFSENGSETIPTAITLYGGTPGKSGASGSENNEIAGFSNNQTGLASLYASSNAHLYKNVEIEMGINSFVFYGEAATVTGQEAKHVGKLENTFDELVSTSTLKDIKFSPSPRFSGSSVGVNGTAIATYLSKVAATKDDNNNAWSNTSHAGLRTLYNNFISITTGSWANVKAVMQRVYKNVKPFDDDTQATKNMKNAIRTAITSSISGVTADNDDNLTFSSDYSNYPADINLPDGAAYVKWDENETNPDNKFKPIITEEQNTGLNVAPLSNYVYPASLYYWVKSDIKTSEEAKMSYSDTDTWTTITNGYNNGDRVTSKTRSIVITKPVQYAVARLDVTVTAVSSLKDGTRNANGDIVGTVIKLTDDNGASLFPITGIMVGSQKSVNYAFEQISSDNKQYTMYDSEVRDDSDKQIFLSTTKTSAIHTLLLESNDATSSTDTDADVQIAVEFMNNGEQTIVGANGQYILPKTKFYLLGTIHPWKSTETNPAIKRVFKQDYTTIANLTISSLKNAHNTLPDLSVPQLDLGLSIDMTWKQGVTYDITIE